MDLFNKNSIQKQPDYTILNLINLETKTKQKHPTFD